MLIQTITPIQIRLSKFYGYGISILSIEVNNKSRAIGFNVIANNLNDKKQIVLRIYFYKFLKHILLKEIPISHYQCKEHKVAVSKGDWFCPECKDWLIDNDVEFINHKHTT